MSAPGGGIDARPALVFAHANGFPGGVYRRLLDALAPRFETTVVDRFGHAPAHPVERRWTGLRDELIAHVRTHAAHTRPWLVGHSLGGYLSLLAAARLGEAVSGVVLLDSPLIAGRAGLAIRWGRRFGFDRYLMPLTQTAQRRSQWPDLDAVHAHFEAKPVFARWDSEVLRDYAEAGTDVVASGRRLRFDPDVELRIYRSLPTRTVVEAARACRVPIALVAGTRSREVRSIGLGATRRVVGSRLTMIEGTHLFPMERPLEAAAAIIEAIDGMAEARHPGP